MLTKKEEKILNSIKVRSDNDPKNPEFPPENPKFPATPTHKINVPGFTNVWLKDESQNPTGTHKDRMAWEMVVTYKDFLLSKKMGQITKLPNMSIITSGSAGYAIQKRLKEYRLPHLKCLVDSHLDEKVKAKLESVACEIFETDLSKKPFSWEEILKLTNNHEEIDITSSEALDPTTRFYDWLSYEIINNSPDYCFIPFGTGNLYENILNINKKEVSSLKHDPRFKGNVEKLRKCNFIGVTVNNPRSKADKLYSPHLPFVHFGEQWIKLYKYAAYCGNKSDVHILKEKYLDQAIKLGDELGLTFEPSGIAGLGMLLQMKNKIIKNAKILIVNTGKTKYS
ncbi:pyridoxal-phosphate dependent enzyme [Candidatus Pacearchaeota archaeon]|nr:pyridoxal-phosphate dependent enzyme [Candidatus Pacearchaeota archaeon]